MAASIPTVGSNAFQGNFGVLDVTIQGPQIAAVGRIQEGINFLPSAGGTVNILAGTYVENVQVNKAASLVGVAALSGTTTIETAFSGANPGGSGVLPTGSATVILIQSSGVSIKNLTINGSTPGLAGAVVEGGVNINARNGIADDTASFPTSAFNNTTISGVVVENVFLRGINLGSGGVGFSVTNNSLVNIIGSTSGTDISAAIAVTGGSGTIGGTAAGSANTITSATQGIVDSRSLGTVIVDNIISGVNVGIHSDNLVGGLLPEVIQGNTINNPTSLGKGTFATAIYVFAPAAAASIQYNAVGGASGSKGFDVGLADYGSTGTPTPIVTFLGNTLTNTTTGFNTSILITTGSPTSGATLSGNVSAVLNGNTITNATNVNSTGIQIATAGAGSTVTVNAVSNQIINSTVAILQQAGVDGSNLKINGNAFVGTLFGYHDLGTGTTDATYNFSGAANGPTVGSNTNPNTGSTIIDSTSGGGTGVVNYGAITSTSGNYLPTRTGTGSFAVTVTPTSSAPTTTPTFTVTVTALYVAGLVPILGVGTVDKNYQGQVSFSSSGLFAPINGTNSYTFTGAEQGTKTFAKVATATPTVYGSAPVVVTDVSTASAATTNVVSGRSANVSVTGAGTTTTLTLPSTFTFDGSPYTVTATVTPTNTSASTPTGSVNFFLAGPGVTGNGFIGSAPISSVTGTTGKASFTFTPSTFGVAANNYTITAAYATDGVFSSSTSAPKTVAIEKTPNNPFGVYAIGSGPGVASLVSVTTASGTTTFSPFGGFTGGVRVAVGDVYGTGTAEIICAAGPGGSPLVSIFSTSGQLLQSITAYGSGFTGGVYVAAANLNPTSSKNWEIITGAGALSGGQALVNTYLVSSQGATPLLLNQFNAYPATSGQTQRYK